MLIVLHAANALDFVRTQRLIGEGVKEEYFFTRTKNNNLQVQIVKQAIDINGHKSFNGQGHKVLDWVTGFGFLELVLVFAEVVFGVEGKGLFVL